MVKKRPGRASAANRNKNDDKDIKSLTSGDDVMIVARDRFKGALQGLIVHSDEESSSSADESAVSPPPPTKTPIKKELTPQKRRRRKKVIETPDQVFHHTFVMKLFDRSVDLAQFTEDTPLYPICRAWMANQPRINYDVIKQESTNDSTKKIKLENGSPEPSSNNMLDVKEVCVMPLPAGNPITRIPSPEPSELQEITSETFEMNVNKGILLSEHMQRWTRIRRKWLDAAQTNENRYSESGKILTEMFKNSQKAYI